VLALLVQASIMAYDKEYYADDWPKLPDGTPNLPAEACSP